MILICSIIPTLPNLRYCPLKLPKSGKMYCRLRFDGQNCFTSHDACFGAS